MRKDKPASDGTLPVILQVLENRKMSKVSLGFRVHPDHFDSERGKVRRSHHQHSEFNEKINQAVAKELGNGPRPKPLVEEIIESQQRQQELAEAAYRRGEAYVPNPDLLNSEAKQFVEELNAAGRSAKKHQLEQDALVVEKEKVWAQHLEQRNTKRPETAIPGLLEYAEQYKKELLRNQQVGTYDVYNAVFSKVHTYLKGADIQLTAVTVKWLTDYDLYMQEVLGNAVNTRKKNFQCIRSLLNIAIRADLLETNPFKKFKIKTEYTEKKMLTLEQVQAIEQIPIPAKQNKHHYRQMFIFACHSGLRISDCLKLKWKHVRQGRIVMATEKTNSQVTVKLVGKAATILESYRTAESKPNDFVFPFLKHKAEKTAKTLFSAISSQTAICNKYLRRIHPAE